MPNDALPDSAASRGRLVVLSLVLLALLCIFVVWLLWRVETFPIPIN